MDHLHGAQNPADLTLNRGSGLFALDWNAAATYDMLSDTYVCESHWRELGSDWNNIKYYHSMKRKERTVCSVPDIFDKLHDKRSPRPFLDRKQKLFYLTKRQAHAVLKERNFHLHPGLCKTSISLEVYF